MTRLFLRISNILAILIFVQLSCSRTTGIAGDSTPDVKEISKKSTEAENPFLRKSNKPSGESCLTIFLEASGETSSKAMVVSNQCNFAVALLTSPLEVRVRLTGREAFVNEQMNRSAAYAILYFVDAALGAEGFQGDGVARDGGLQVLGPPGYTTVRAMGTVKIPLECDVAVPAGRYFMPLMTYEAPQGDAPTRNDPFDCGETVEHFNGKNQKSVSIFLSDAARQVSSRSMAIDWPSKEM